MVLDEGGGLHACLNQFDPPPRATLLAHPSEPTYLIDLRGYNAPCFIANMPMCMEVT